jgi:pyruvate dehydrogenase E1 component
VPDQIARWIPLPFVPLGTDGFGLSDARAPLRRHFEVDATHVVVAALYGLAQRGDVKADVVAAAIEQYAIDADAPDPTGV